MLNQWWNKIHNLWSSYSEWCDSLPYAISVIVMLLTCTSPWLMVLFVSVSIIEYADKTKCLDSQYPRRWVQKTAICQEYQDETWIEIDPDDIDIYFYNDAAGRQKIK